MTKQPTQRQADDIDIRSGLARQPQKFSVIGVDLLRRVLILKNNVLYECKLDQKMWRCGACRGRLGQDPKPGKQCRGCGGRVR